jgi:transposase
MEDVLDVYQRPYDPKRPVVCLDECSKELRDTPRGTLPMEPADIFHPALPAREDYEYARHGTANVSLAVEPLAGRRFVKVTHRRTAIDLAEMLRYLVDEVYADAEKIVLVTDNLNTHHEGALYELLCPEHARRIARRIEWHYTPEHGSWLNMAECELSVLMRQCLDRRMPLKEVIAEQVHLWQQERNNNQATINWQFTTNDARVKLRRLYPQMK